MTRRRGRTSARRRRAREAPAAPPAAPDPWLEAGRTPLDPPRRRAAAWLFAIAAAIITFVAFLPALDNEFVDWDDTGLLVENPSWRGLGREQLAWMFSTNYYGHYQPITWLTYGADYVIWEMNPRGYHLTNNLFHALNAFLMFFVSVILLRRGFVGNARVTEPLVSLAAFVATLLFALHPLRVESVAWATERRDLVSACFILLTLLAYLRAAAPTAPRRVAWLGISLGLFVISMLGKVGGAPLPVVLLLLDWYPLRRLPLDPRGWLARPAWPVLLEKVPYFALAFGFALATVLQQTDRWLIPYETHSFTARIAQAFYGLAFYPWKTFVPVGLLPLYELHTPLNPLAPRFVVSAIAVGAAAVAAWGLRRRAPGLAVALLVMAAMLGPLLGFFQNGPQLVADRYSYLSTHGIALLVAAGLAILAARSRAPIAVLCASGAVLAAPLAVLAWRQCDVWQDTTTLWAYNVEHEPDNSFANNGHGYMLMTAGRHAEAIPYLHRAVEIKPDNREAHVNLWNALDAVSSPEIDAALAHSAEVAPNDIRALALHRLGNEARRAGRDEEAIDHYRRALGIDPSDARVYVNMGLSLQHLQRTDEARRAYEAAIRRDPLLFQAHYNLGNLLRRAGACAEALREYEISLTLRPDHADAQRFAAECRSRLE